MLRRPEGATVAQIAEATGWAQHTVRGFFAGLKKKGHAVEVRERIRQVGPNKTGAKGSFTIYALAEWRMPRADAADQNRLSVTFVGATRQQRLCAALTGSELECMKIMFKKANERY